MSIRIGARVCANEGEIVSLAYLWRETPIQAPVQFNLKIALLQPVVCPMQVWGAPIYGDDIHRLPSPPAFWEDIGAA